MVILPNEAIKKVLSAAYSCPHFSNSISDTAISKKCLEANFLPVIGQIPRGFIGATGKPEDVEAIFVLSEPGHPHSDESYDAKGTADSFLAAVVTKAHDSFSNGTDRFHRNVRFVIDQFWPNQNFDEQLKRVWITEGRLCSIKNEIGKLNDRICASLYLKQQILLLPNAIVITFGVKAKERVNQIKGLEDRVILNAWALAPPGSNRKEAKASWARVIAEFKEIKIKS